MQNELMEDVRRHLDELRRRTGIRPGDEFDLILMSVEGLALTMDAMSVNASDLVAAGQRSVGATVSAAMTTGVLWRLYVMPAVIGSAFALLIMSWATTSAYQACGSQRDADRAMITVQSDKLNHQYDEYRLLLQNYEQAQQAALDKERARIELTLPGLLIERADHLSGVARGLVQLEASNPGILEWVGGLGAAAKKITDKNGSLCPITYISGITPMCAYAKP